MVMVVATVAVAAEEDNTMATKAKVHLNNALAKGGQCDKSVSKQGTLHSSATIDLVTPIKPMKPVLQLWHPPTHVTLTDMLILDPPTM